MSAVRASKGNGFSNLFSGHKSLLAHLALELSVTAVIIVKIFMRRLTTGTAGIGGYVLARTPSNRFKGFLITLLIVGQ